MLLSLLDRHEDLSYTLITSPGGEFLILLITTQAGEYIITGDNYGRIYYYRRKSVFYDYWWVVCVRFNTRISFMLSS